MKGLATVSVIKPAHGRCYDGIPRQCGLRNRRLSQYFTVNLVGKKRVAALQDVGEVKAGVFLVPLEVHLDIPARRTKNILPVFRRRHPLRIAGSSVRATANLPGVAVDNVGGLIAHRIGLVRKIAIGNGSL